MLTRKNKSRSLTISCAASLRFPECAPAAISAALPLVPKRITPVLPEGQPEVPLAERPFIIIEAISPAWFKTMHVPLQAGREFTDADKAGAPNVVIVNQALARRYWPNQNPIGKHIVMGRQPASEVVGVAADVNNRGLALDPAGTALFPVLPTALGKHEPAGAYSQ